MWALISTITLQTETNPKQRFTGPQILRFHRRFPKVYEKTARISLVSSFLCSLFLGRIAPFEISDVCGMNLWDIEEGVWDEKLLATTAEGEKGGVEGLKKRLGPVETEHGKHLGKVSSWFVDRFGFNPGLLYSSPDTSDNLC